jgi:hypothetical protein
LDYFKDFIEGKYSVPVVVGTHPIPEHYAQTHSLLSSRAGVVSRAELMSSEEARAAYE